MSNGSEGRSEITTERKRDTAREHTLGGDTVPFIPNETDVGEDGDRADLEVLDSKKPKSSKPGKQSTTGCSSDTVLDLSSFVVLYRGTSFDPKANPRLAAEYIDDRNRKVGLDFDPVENGAATSISRETGYMMRFAQADHHRRLNEFDLLAMPNLKSYPVPQESLLSLPAVIRARLEERGIVKINCVYTGGKFYGARLGWERPTRKTATRWLACAVDAGCSPVAALDYYMVNVAREDETEEPHTVETWADVRNVTPKAIEKNLGLVREALDLGDDVELAST